MILVVLCFTLFGAFGEENKAADVCSMVDGVVLVQVTTNVPDTEHGAPAVDCSQVYAEMQARSTEKPQDDKLKALPHANPINQQHVDQLDKKSEPNEGQVAKMRRVHELTLLSTAKVWAGFTNGRLDQTVATPSLYGSDRTTFTDMILSGGFQIQLTDLVTPEFLANVAVFFPSTISLGSGISASEVSALRAWVESGGILIHIVEGTSDLLEAYQPLLDEFSVVQNNQGAYDGTLAVLAAHELTNGVSQISFGNARLFDVVDPQAIALFGRNGKDPPTGVVLRDNVGVGNGALVYIGDATMYRDSIITDQDNEQLFTNLVEWAGNHTTIFLDTNNQTDVWAGLIASRLDEGGVATPSLLGSDRTAFADMITSGGFQIQLTNLITPEFLANVAVFFPSAILRLSLGGGLSVSEVSALRAWVDSGGILIHILEGSDYLREAYGTLLAEFNVLTSDDVVFTANLTSMATHELTNGVSQIYFQNTVGFNVTDQEATVLFAVNNTPGVVVRDNVGPGNGALVYIGDATLYRNSYITREDNEQFFLNLVEWAKLRTSNQTAIPTPLATVAPTQTPTVLPTQTPTSLPTQTPTGNPTLQPTSLPTPIETLTPTALPSPQETAAPGMPSSTADPTPSATLDPAPSQTNLPTTQPTISPTPSMTGQPTGQPTAIPSPEATQSPTNLPSAQPTGPPTSLPTISPTILPTPSMIDQPTDAPSAIPSPPTTTAPTNLPSTQPTGQPSSLPTIFPTPLPTPLTSLSPTQVPTVRPTVFPTLVPTGVPFPTTGGCADFPGWMDSDGHACGAYGETDACHASEARAQNGVGATKACCYCGGGGKIVIICEGSSGEIICDEGETIHLLEHFYGRSDAHICPDPDTDTNMSCTSLDSGPISDNCEGEKSCSLNVTRTLFGDYCNGTTSYIKAIYHCVVSSIGIPRVCAFENTTVSSSVYSNDVAHCFLTENEAGEMETELVSQIVEVDFGVGDETVENQTIYLEFEYQSKLQGDCEKQVDFESFGFCGWYDHETEEWRDDGCEVVDVSRSPDNQENQIVTCKCTHTTAFALIQDVSKTKGHCETSIVLGNPVFVIFAQLYTILLLVCIIQLCHIFQTLDYKRVPRATYVHALVAVISFINIVIFYTLWTHDPTKPFESLGPIIVIWAFLYCLLLWAFINVIRIWIGIVVASTNMSHRRARFASRVCVSIGIVATLIVFGMFFSLAFQENNIPKFVRIGSGINAFLCIALALSYTIVGVILANQIDNANKRTRTSIDNSKSLDETARRIFRVSTVICFGFFTQGVIVFISAVHPEQFFKHFTAFESVYLIFDLICLTMLLYLYFRVIMKTYGEHGKSTVVERSGMRSGSSIASRRSAGSVVRSHRSMSGSSIELQSV